MALRGNLEQKGKDTIFRRNSPAPSSSNSGVEVPTNNCVVGSADGRVKGPLLLGCTQRYWFIAKVIGVEGWIQMDSAMLWFSSFMCKLLAKKDLCQDDILSISKI